MMSYNSKDGTFPLAKKECEFIAALCSEKCFEMDTDLENKDSHTYILIKSLIGKMDGYVNLMNARKVTEDRRKKEDIETANHLRGIK